MITTLFEIEKTPRFQKRPWGGYIDHYRPDDKSVCFKTLYIEPGHQVSEQYHNNRSEVWWISDEVTAYELTLGENKAILYGQRKIEIPKTLIHCIRNYSSLVLVIDEMQYGICEEEDIVRTKDPYANQR